MFHSCPPPPSAPPPHPSSPPPPYTTTFQTCFFSFPAYFTLSPLPHPSPSQPFAPHVPPYYTVVAGRLVIRRPLHTVLIQYSNGLAFP